MAINVQQFSQIVRDFTKNIGTEPVAPGPGSSGGALSRALEFFEKLKDFRFAEGSSTSFCAAIPWHAYIASAARSNDVMRSTNL
jgi:hypothetical protein